MSSDSGVEVSDLDSRVGKLEQGYAGLFEQVKSANEKLDLLLRKDTMLPDGYVSKDICKIAHNNVVELATEAKTKVEKHIEGHSEDLKAFKNWVLFSLLGSAAVGVATTLIVSALKAGAK